MELCQLLMDFHSRPRICAFLPLWLVDWACAKGPVFLLFFASFLIFHFVFLRLPVPVVACVRLHPAKQTRMVKSSTQCHNNQAIGFRVWAIHVIDGNCFLAALSEFLRESCLWYVDRVKNKERR